MQSRYYGMNKDAAKTDSTPTNLAQNPNFHQTQYRTNVPGRVAILGSNPNGEIFERRTGGGIANSMSNEELEMRKAGKPISKEFLAEKRRKEKEGIEK